MYRVPVSGDDTAFIAERISAFEAEAPPEWRWQLPYVRKFGALPLHLGWTETLALLPDGRLVRWSTERDCADLQPIEAPMDATLALVEASRLYPVLAHLFPERPYGAVCCASCGGSGRLPEPLVCICGGTGWTSLELPELTNESPTTVVELGRALDACARVLAREPSSPTPDAIAAASGSVKWNALPGWESMSDGQIAIRSGVYAAGLRGSLLVVTESCFVGQMGAFAVEAAELGSLIHWHAARQGESFFNGDVVIVEKDGARIWLFHHEGAHATIVRASA